MDILKKEWFKFTLITLLVATMFIYYRGHSFSKAEIYKFNTACAQEAQKFAKEKTDNFILWEVLQSGFIAEKEACFAEFHLGVLGSSAVIYDLTHSKELASRSNLVFEANKEYTEMAKKYEDLKGTIFEVQK